MAEAGISRYCRDPEVKLSQLGDGGTAISAWLKNDAAKDITEGRGVAVVGKGKNAFRAFQLLARGVLLGLHQNSRLISLPRIMDLLAAGEAYNTIAEADCLFVEGFFSDHYKSPQGPYPEDKVAQVEWLFQWYAKRGGILFFLATDKLADCRWWSPMFLGEVADRTREVCVP